MDQSPEHIVYLWKQFASKQASGEELDEFFDYISKAEDHEFSNAFFDQYFAGQVTGEKRGKEYWLNKLERIIRAGEVQEDMISETTADLKTAANGFPSQPVVHRIHFFKTAWFRYAAILLLIAGISTFLYIVNKKPEQEIVQQQPTGIMPGSDKAVLTLAGGEQIQLDSNANALLAEKGISNHDAVITYIDPPAVATTNVLTTPRGGQYKLQLPDGTVVWLNAASSITYPTNFTGEERRVTVTGEVYFEVAPDKKKPFFVKTADISIQILGTSLNINAYSNETATRTTLITGNIRVTSGAGDVLLKPGQQAITNGTGLQVVNTDISKAIAWKNGQFNFEGVGVAELMRQVERWYDVKVVYQSTVPTMKFAGTVKRNMSLTDLLEVLGKTGVHYTSDTNRTIIIFP